MVNYFCYNPTGMLCLRTFPAPGKSATLILRGKILAIPQLGGADDVLILRLVDGLRGSGEAVDLEVASVGEGAMGSFKPEAVSLVIQSAASTRTRFHAAMPIRMVIGISAMRSASSSGFFSADSC